MGCTNTGQSHPKLQRALVGFVQWIMRMGSDEVVLPITEPLLTPILAALEQQEIPVDLRQVFYISIGLIANRKPELMQQRPEILRFLFEAAIREPPTVKVSITECLSMVFPAVQNPPPEFAEELLALIQEAVQTVPTVAVKFAFAFPFSNVAARGICLRVLSQFGISSDLKQSAKYGLDPYYFKITTQISRTVLPPEFFSFPTFEDAVSGLVGLDGVDVVETLRFLRTVWLHEALRESFKFDDEGWRNRLDTAVEVDDAVRSTIKSILQKWTQGRHVGLERYFAYLRHVLTTGTDDQVGLAASFLLELVSLGGKDISAALTPDTNAIKELVFSRNELLREKAAHLLGNVGANSANVESMVRGLLRFSEGSIERQHGAMLAVGSILSRLALQGTLTSISSEIQDKFATDVTQIIVSTNTNTVLLEAGLQALSELCIFGAGIFQEAQRDQIITRLQALAKSNRHGNLQDRAVLTLGYLSFSFTLPKDEGATTKILDSLYLVHEQKQVELLFSAGQALSCVAARWNSKAMTPYRDADFFEMLPDPVPQILERVLSTVLDGVRSPKHPLRKVLR